MANDTCEATITKRLACQWSHQQLVAMSFLSFSLCFRNNTKNHKYILFNVSFLVSIVHFSFHFVFLFFIFFSFDSLKHRRTINTHVNKPVKLLSLPLMWIQPIQPLCYNKSIKEAKAHTLFKTTLFMHSFPPIKFWRRCLGWERFDLIFLLTLLHYFWCAG